MWPYLLNIKIQHAHLKCQDPASPDADLPTIIVPNPGTAAFRGRAVARSRATPKLRVRALEQPQNEPHHCIGHLLGLAHVDVDHPAQPEVGREGRVHGLIRGSKAHDQFPGSELTLGGAREERERVDKDRRGQVDPRLSQSAQWHVLHLRHAGEAFLLERHVLDAIERDNHRMWMGLRSGATTTRHCRRIYPPLSLL
ncbi:snaclec alboaggregin-A subunit alpha [Striga asiatica]|uniref:Snaclec alboaggregin-A subunit alpha n=1 Tax=Striga asiatica TaxID=4170 RepID=A0A5A7P1V9_STRAF|nr:snaclec alboaggregin-A subunit alpha [Striga asiatica]